MWSMEMIKLFLKLTVFPSRVMENLESGIWPANRNIFSHLDGCVSMNGRRKLVLANRRNSVRVNCVAQFRRMSKTMLPCRRSYTNTAIHIDSQNARQPIQVSPQCLCSLQLCIHHHPYHAGCHNRSQSNPSSLGQALSKSRVQTLRLNWRKITD